VIPYKQAKEGQYAFLQAHPEIPLVADDGVDFRMLWHAGYWDGPLSGLCLYKGVHHYFQCVEDFLKIPNPQWKGPEDEEEDEFDYTRAFVIKTLKEDVLAELFRRHAVWNDLVGCHTDYVYEEKDGRLHRRRKEWYDPKNNPNNERGNYWEIAKTWPRLSMEDGDVVAWWGFGITPENRASIISSE